MSGGAAVVVCSHAAYFSCRRARSSRVLTPSQIIVFDLTTWVWITPVCGIVVGLAGLGLLSGAGWARWVTIIVGSLDFIVQLGFVGSAQYPLWALTGPALTAVVLYALIVRWDDARPLA